jgi:hypothetical protein
MKVEELAEEYQRRISILHKIPDENGMSWMMRVGEYVVATDGVVAAGTEFRGGDFKHASPSTALVTLKWFTEHIEYSHIIDPRIMLKIVKQPPRAIKSAKLRYHGARAKFVRLWDDVAISKFACRVAAHLGRHDNLITVAYDDFIIRVEGNEWHLVTLPAADHIADDRLPEESILGARQIPSAP